MKIQLTDDFDAKKIAESGQCFRWHPLAEHTYRIFAGNRTAVLHQLSEDTIEIDCTPEEFQMFWAQYFDLSTDYTALRTQISAQDSYLQRAAEYGRGIRILRQDSWEMLITFLLSQRKSIPAIRKAVEALCTAAGTPLGSDADGRTLYAFPTPEQLCALDDDTLAACGLGYRLPYVRQAAQTAKQNPALFAELAALGDDALLKALLGFYGVGAKISHCVMLFGFHRLNAFPQDVWIHRVLDAHYPNGFPLAAYTPFNGVMQQYLFFYIRADKQM